MSKLTAIFRLNRLAFKYLMVMLPVFVAFMLAGLFAISDRSAKQADDQLNARLGALTASIAGAVEQELPEGDIRSTQLLATTLLSDRAIDCIEIANKGTGIRSIAAPMQLGCKGVSDVNTVIVSVGDTEEYSLEIRFNKKEVEAVTRTQREFTLIALIASLLVAAAAGIFGFNLIVGRPLASLLSAIQQSAETGNKSHIATVPNDELGTIIKAYNQMQARLAQDSESLADEIEQRKVTEDRLLKANTSLETAKNLLEDQFDRIEQQRNEQNIILDNMPHSVIWLDQDHNVKMRSRRVAEVHCIAEREYQHVMTLRDHVMIVGKRGDLGPYANQDELLAIVDERVEALCDHEDLENGIRIHFASENRWIQVRIAKLPNGGCILGQHDITDQVLAEQAAEQARADLEEANLVLESRIEERTRELRELQESLIENESDKANSKRTSKSLPRTLQPVDRTQAEA